VWSLVEDHLIDPSNEEFVRTYVDSPGAVGVVALDVPSIEALKGMSKDAVRVTLVGQYRAAFGLEMWEIPAGMRDVEGEPPELTAHRELVEEAGLEAASMKYLGTIASAPGITNSTVQIFVAWGLSAADTSRHGPEEVFMNLRSITFAEAIEEIRDGRIIDSKTVIGLQWVAEFF